MLRCVLVQAPGQVQRGSGEGSGRSWGVPESSGQGLGGGSEGLGAEAGQVQRGSGKFRRRFRKALVQSRQVQRGSGKFRRMFRRRFGRSWCRGGPGSTRFRKVPEEVLEGFGAEPPGSTRFRKVLDKVSEKVRKVLVQRRARFNEVPESSGGGSGRLWCRAARFNEVPESSGECFGEGSEGLGAEVGQTQRGFKVRFRECVGLAEVLGQVPAHFGRQIP